MTWGYMGEEAEDPFGHGGQLDQQDDDPPLNKKARHHDIGTQVHAPAAAPHDDYSRQGAEQRAEEEARD